MAPKPDLGLLPSGPLSMALLLELEPAGLRRLLKFGLRGGLPHAGLESVLQAEWSWSITDPEAEALLQALADKGWFVRQVDVWKTHLAR
ncbi:MAG: hypothetical protein RLZZ263_1550 [Cyanobacteriota bacterium]